MEESIGTFLGLLCTFAPCLVLLGAIGGGITFFVKRSKKASTVSRLPVTPASNLHSTPGPAVAAAQPAASHPEGTNPDSLPLVPSEIVALRGDVFAPSAGVFNSWKLAGSETKVSGPPLAQVMLAAAFLALEKAGDIRLAQGKKKAALGLREVDTVLVIPGEQSYSWPEGSFEARISSSSRNLQDSNRNNVKDLVHNALGEDASLVWDWALRLAHSGMAKRGLLEAEAKKGLLSGGLTRYNLTPQTHDALSRANPEEIRALLQSCERNRPGLFQLLNHEIKKGFDSRKEAPDTDIGGPDFAD